MCAAPWQPDTAMRTKLAKPIVLDVIEEAFSLEASRTRHARVRARVS